MLLRISRRQRTNVRKSEEIPRWRARNEKASFTVAKLYLSFLMKCLFIPLYSVFLFFDAGVMIYPAYVVKLLNSSVFRAVIRKQYGKNC